MVVNMGGNNTGVLNRRNWSTQICGCMEDCGGCKYVINELRHEKTGFLAHLSRRLIGELIIYQWSGVPPSSRPSSRPSSTMLKRLLLRNRLANQNQILCEGSLGRGNESLFAASGSHDQDGRHAHIW